MKWGLSLTAHYYQVDARGLCKGLKCNHCELVLIYPVTLMKHINRDTSWYFRKTIPFPLFPLKECVLGSTRVEGQVAVEDLVVDKIFPRPWQWFQPTCPPCHSSRLSPSPSWLPIWCNWGLFFSPGNTSHGTDSLENLLMGARMTIRRWKAISDLLTCAYCWLCLTSSL